MKEMYFCLGEQGFRLLLHTIHKVRNLVALLNPLEQGSGKVLTLRRSLLLLGAIELSLFLGKVLHCRVTHFQELYDDTI